MRKYALISVSDKTGLVEFSREIVSLGYDIIATGNTAKMIRENQIECTEVEDLTKFPEIFSGRVKTLQPKIFGGFEFQVPYIEPRNSVFYTTFTGRS